VELQLAEVNLAFCQFDEPDSLCAEIDPGRLGCVLSELKLGGLTALQLVKQLRQRRIQLPVVLITSYATVPLTVQAFRAGLFEVLEKPCDSFQLWDCVTRAFESHKLALDEARRASDIRNRFSQLSRQELQVMQMLLDGQPNKRIAAELGVSPRTIVFRRKCLMQKLNAQSVAELAYLAQAVAKGNGHSGDGNGMPQLDTHSLFSR
jgi:two-component system response regulator FixJ